MLGRHVLLRLGGPTRLISSTNNLSVRVTWPVWTHAQRPYSTPGRPRSTVGEPSRTVKRAVKARAREAGAAATPTTKPAKKAAPKKKAVAKPKPKKKILTEAQIEAKKAKTEKDKVKALQTVALLDAPKRHTLTAYNVYVAENTKGRLNLVASRRIKEISQAFKALTPAELEHWNHVAGEQSKRRAAEYDAWLQSYSAEDIAKANNARSQLRRKLKKSAGLGKLHDERRVKGRISAFIAFATERRASGDFRNISVGESSKLMGKEWHALSASERESYREAAQATNAERGHSPSP